jgi:hypothetical protein
MKGFKLQENFKGIVITRSYTFFVKHCNFQEMRKMSTLRVLAC